MIYIYKIYAFYINQNYSNVVSDDYFYLLNKSYQKY